MKRDPIFCYKHAEIKHGGKCPKCVWQGEKTPNEALTVAAARTPEQQSATLMAALGF
jgi:hypothetical protein